MGSMTDDKMVAYGKLTSLEKHTPWDMLADYFEIKINDVLEMHLLIAVD
jgi:hypothetical protein